jgi:hypothetical protein
MISLKCPRILATERMKGVFIVTPNMILNQVTLADKAEIPDSYSRNSLNREITKTISDQPRDTIFGIYFLCYIHHDP